MGNYTTEGRTLKQLDYVKLMQLLPRLRLDLERAGDDKGAAGVQVAINRTGKRAKAFIDEIENGADVQSEGERLGIVKINA